MASEVSLSVSLSASKGGVDVSASYSATADLSGEDMIDCTQTISTGATLISVGAITGNPQFLLVKNLDSTNFITLSANANFNANSEVFGKILPGKFNLISPATPIYAKADSANCKLAVEAIEI